MSIEQGAVVNGVRDVLQAGADPAQGGWIANVTDDDVQDAVKEVLDKLKAKAVGTPGADPAAEPEGDEGWSPFVDVLELTASPAKPPVVLPGMAWSGRLSVLSGAPKAGKSTALAQAIGCRLSGEAFAGESVAPRGPVALVTEEPLEMLAQRLRIYGVGDGHKGAVYVASPAQGVERLIDALHRSEPEVVIIDSFASWAVAGGCETLSDPAVMRRAMDTLRGLSEEGVGVLVVHHARRSDGELADSRDIAASVDMIVNFEAVDPDFNRCAPRASDLRRLSYSGRWPTESVVLDFDRADRRYSYQQKGDTA
ncbi:MAG: AAA family ATPase [Acidobacteriota bacterium]|nr:AAA family ATPase [Acidobacteriota bacterium]